MALVVGDCEVAPNYCLALFLDRRTWQTFRWERHDDKERGRSREELKQFLRDNTVIGFNWDGYDFAIVQAYLHGFLNEQIKAVSDWVIQGDALAQYHVLKQFDLPSYEYKSIDLMPVAPKIASLKVYAARIRSPHIQDLPYLHTDLIDEDMRDQTIAYCEQDLANTNRLFDKLRGELSLRNLLSKEYGIYLLSKSDPQIAEAVMRTRVRRAGGEAWPMKEHERPQPPFRYTPPEYLKFETVELSRILDTVKGIEFGLDKKGDLALPDVLKPVAVDDDGNRIRLRKDRPNPAVFEFEGQNYKIGIGGLHTQEKAQHVSAHAGEYLFFADVASYYPNLILTNNWYPAHIGPVFVDEYRSLVDTRLAAKAEAGRLKGALKETTDPAEIKRLERAIKTPQIQADAGKISINSIFGKLGNRYSAFYAPELLLHVTLTGQFALLMLVEMVTGRSDAKVVSANTDGILIWAPNEKSHVAALGALREWESRTALVLEEDYLQTVASQAVNSYVAIGRSGKVKGKGSFAAQGLGITPVYPIVATAVTEALKTGTPIEDTIAACDDLYEFVALRKSGQCAQWNDERIGHTCRWYAGLSGSPITTLGGSQVANSEIAVVCQTMPTGAALATALRDIDRDYYVTRARQLMADCGGPTTKHERRAA